MATIRWCPIFPKWDIYQPLCSTFKTNHPRILWVANSEAAQSVNNPSDHRGRNLDAPHPILEMHGRQWQQSCTGERTRVNKWTSMIINVWKYGDIISKSIKYSWNMKNVQFFIWPTANDGSEWPTACHGYVGNVGLNKNRPYTAGRKTHHKKVWTLQSAAMLNGGNGWKKCGHRRRVLTIIRWICH